ncbi:hypothetical protein [Sphingomonas morindae]|uniref:Uncharacterized protein n=1 Tax=Sphingomonas morindae TaxID=1541170 RepID=A0ABY4XC02_9SPHN|nr:hypothetical protein [Sphingomonas morindae]USI74414.1 hypothetical protein LHA26_08175 [Sphingomonas morindae]
MLGTFTGSMVATLVREATGAPPAGPLATALIGSGASLVMQRGRRPVGLALLLAGGVVLWREAAAARPRTARVKVRPATRRPAPGLPAASDAAA